MLSTTFEGLSEFERRQPSNPVVLVTMRRRYVWNIIATFISPTRWHSQRFTPRRIFCVACAESSINFVFGIWKGTTTIIIQSRVIRKFREIDDTLAGCIVCCFRDFLIYQSRLCRGGWKTVCDHFIVILQILLIHTWYVLIAVSHYEELSWQSCGTKLYFFLLSTLFTFVCVFSNRNCESELRALNLESQIRESTSNKSKLKRHDLYFSSRAQFWPLFLKTEIETNNNRKKQSAHYEWLQL